MEKIKLVPPFIFQLPTEIIDEILLYLTLSDRKNLRLTCKWLYEWCNADRFCRDEKIIWYENIIHHANSRSDLFRICRSYYNLVIENEELKEFSIFPFFKKHGAKVKSLVIHNCNLYPGSIECIITLCKELRSLCLTSSNGTPNSSLHFSTFKPFSIAHPKVTYLKLTLPMTKPHHYFHRIYSMFPNVKQLKIYTLLEFYRSPNSPRNFEFLSILDEIIKSGSNLEGLKLDFPLNQSIIKETKCFDALTSLKDLSVHFNDEILDKIETWYLSHSNLVSVKLHDLQTFGPSEMILLLANTGLRCLSIQSDTLVFDEESFKKLVSSQLDTIFLSIDKISVPFMNITDSNFQVNKTVKDLNIDVRFPKSDGAFFLEYFHGLVHLSIGLVTNSALQCIFQFQENLRSLELGKCYYSSLHGFCGTKDGCSIYSINDLQKLEHLSIDSIPLEILQSDDFKAAMSLTRLKYLQIRISSLEFHRAGDDHQHAGIQTALYENLTELRALRIRDAALPSRETVSSLFRSLKHLHYLRFDLHESHHMPTTFSKAFINVHREYFILNNEQSKFACPSRQVYYDDELDRMVILNGSLHRTFEAPKISSFKIKWIQS